jgi:hypothetical protein
VISYKIVRLSGSHYPSILEAIIGANLGFNKKTYREQLDCLLDYRALYSDSFSRSMQALGNQAKEIIWDLEITQKTWALENGVRFSSDNWILEILFAQIEKYRPDVVYFQGTELCAPGRFASTLGGGNIATILKERFPFIRLVAMFSGFPSLISRVRGVDLLFACTPAIVEHYRKAGINSVLCYHAFDEDVLLALKGKLETTYDVTFVGSTQAPGERYWMLSELIEHTPLKIWTDNRDENEARERYLQDVRKTVKQSARTKIRNQVRSILELVERRQIKRIAANRLAPAVLRNIVDEVLDSKTAIESTGGNSELKIPRKLPRKNLAELYPERCESPVNGLDYFKVIGRSRVSLNKHTERSLGDVGNLRLFEATGMGSCLLTDYGRNIHHLFEPDTEIVMYRSVGEAIEKIGFLLENESAREAIAIAGQRKTLKSHTIWNRCQLINENLKARL